MGHIVQFRVMNLHNPTLLIERHSVRMYEDFNLILRDIFLTLSNKVPTTFGVKSNFGAAFDMLYRKRPFFFRFVQFS